jgi:sialidase-1
MDRANLANGSYVDVHQGVGGRDWKIDEDWVPPDGVGTRPGFVHVPVLAAENPGAELEFPFTGNAVGIAVVSGPDAGIIEYNIDGGAFKKIDLYTQWSNSLHLPWYLLLGSGLTEAPHKLRLRIDGDRSLKSKGTSCRIVHFLLNTRY